MKERSNEFVYGLRVSGTYFGVPNHSALEKKFDNVHNINTILGNIRMVRIMINLNLVDVLGALKLVTLVM